MNDIPTNTVILDHLPAEKVVEQFFQNFHAQDTTALRSMFTKDAYLQSLSIKENNKTVSQTSLEKFLTSIASIPASVDFEEELTAVKSLGNDAITSVHADYIFRLNGNVSHRGTNVFTMVFLQDRWIITQITDTRFY
jgi:hypothetical protein